MVEPRLKSELSGFRTQAHSFYTMGLGRPGKGTFQVLCCPDYDLFSIQVGSSTSLIFPDASSWCGDSKTVFQPGKQFSAPAMQENEQDTTRKLLFPMWHQILSPSTHSLPLHFISPIHSSHCPTVHTATPSHSTSPGSFIYSSLHLLLPYYYMHQTCLCDIFGVGSREAANISY